MNFILIAAGFVLLLAGGEALVRGSIALARRFHVSPLVIGVTVVGFGTSAPELVVGVDAALAGASGITVGNVIGSNLANMMLILALRTDAERVYGRALLQFAPEDIGEAFAATHSVTLPSQSRSSLALIKKDRGVDLIADFRRLAPPSDPISIQRWSPRRLRLTVGAVMAIILAVSQVIREIQGGGIL